MFHSFVPKLRLFLPGVTLLPWLLLGQEPAAIPTQPGLGTEIRRPAEMEAEAGTSTPAEPTAGEEEEAPPKAVKLDAPVPAANSAAAGPPAPVPAVPPTVRPALDASSAAPEAAPPVIPPAMEPPPPVIPAPQTQTPKKWTVVPEFTDEFNGDKLDFQKWMTGIHGWKGREPALNMPENVQVKDGLLQITLKPESVPQMEAGYRDFTSGAVSSLNRIRYGFFEVRAKPLKAAAASSFWFSHNAGDQWTEIDVYEIIGNGPKSTNQLHMNAHIFKGMDVDTHRESPMAWPLQFDPTGDFHVYGLMWDAISLKWFVDGKAVRQKPNIYWKQPLHLILDAEVMTHWVGEPDKADLPATYQVDYVRAWQSRGN